MEVVVERAAALDVHKASVFATVRTPRERETRRFGTMTGDLLEMGSWFRSLGITAVAMESTGSYWKPIYNVLEQYDFKLVVCNAQHVKAVPGRKTDVKDSEWLCDLLRHGLLKASFIPSKAQRETRELVRYRESLVHERASEDNRIQKVLEGANIKLGSVATDILGVSGRAMLQALAEGMLDPRQLAGMAKGRLQNKTAELEQALTGVMGPHQRFMLREMLAHLLELDARIDRVSQEIAERLHPFDEALERLDAIPGVGRRAAEVILAEIGTDMSRFPSAAHLAAWSGLAPGNNESAGKRKSGKTRQGDRILRTTLVQAARAAARKRDTYLNAQYHRIAARRGAKRAAVAVAHSIIVIAYEMLSRGTQYQDLGFDYLDRRNKDAIAKRLVRRLKSLGYNATLQTVA